MNMQCKKIIGLPVETESGDHIGKVQHIHIRIDTHEVSAYVILRGGLLRSVVQSETLEILPIHVRSIGKEKMIVADLTISDSVSHSTHTRTQIPTGIGVAPIQIEQE